MPVWLLQPQPGSCPVLNEGGPAGAVDSVQTASTERGAQPCASEWRGFEWQVCELSLNLFLPLKWERCLDAALFAARGAVRWRQWTWCSPHLLQAQRAPGLLLQKPCGGGIKKWSVVIGRISAGFQGCSRLGAWRHCGEWLFEV